MERREDLPSPGTRQSSLTSHATHLITVDRAQETAICPLRRCVLQASTAQLCTEKTT